MAGTLGRVLRHMNSDHLASPGADDPRGNIVLSQKVIFCCLGPAGAWGASHGKIHAPGKVHGSNFFSLVLQVYPGPGVPTLGWVVWLGTMRKTTISPRFRVHENDRMFFFRTGWYDSFHFQ